MSKSIPHASVLAKKDTFDRLEQVKVIPFTQENGCVFLIASIESSPAAKKARQIFVDEIILHLETFAKLPSSEGKAEPQFEEAMQGLNDLLKTWLTNHPNTVDLPRSGILIGSLTENTLVLTGFGQIASMYLHTKGDSDEAYDLVRDIRREAAPSPEKLFRTVMMGILEPGDRAIFGNTAALRLLPKEELAEYLSTLPVAGAAEHINQKAEHMAESVLAFLVKAPEKPAKAQTATHVSARNSVEELARAEHRTEDVLTRTPQNNKEIANRIKQWMLTMLSAGSACFVIALWCVLKIIFAAIKTLFILPLGPGRREKAKMQFRELLKECGQTITTKLEPLTWLMRIVFVLLVIGLFASAIATGKSLSQRKMATIDLARENKIADIRSLQENAEAKLIYRDDTAAKIALDAADKILAEQTDLQTHPAYQELTQTSAKLRKELRKEYMLAIEPGFSLPSEGLRLMLLDKIPYALTKKGEFVSKDRAAIATSLKPTFAWYGGSTAYASDANGTAWSIATDGTVKTLQGVIPNTLSDATMYSGRVYATQPVASAILRMDPITGGFGSARTWQKGTVDALKDARSIVIDSDVYVGTASNVLKFTSGAAQPFRLATIDPSPTDIQRIWTSETSNFLYLLEAKNHRIIVIDKGNGAYIKQYLFDGLDGVTDMLVDEPAKRIWLMSGSTVSLGSM